MSSGLKVLAGCLAAFGVGMVLLMILGMMHWVVLGVAAVVGIYVVSKLARPTRKSLPVGERVLHKRLRKLEKDVDSIRR